MKNRALKALFLDKYMKISEFLEALCFLFSAIFKRETVSPVSKEEDVLGGCVEDFRGSSGEDSGNSTCQTPAS
jgi:hypothetical protein